MTHADRCAAAIRQVGSWLTVKSTNESVLGSLQPLFRGSALPDESGQSERQFVLYLPWNDRTQVLFEGDLMLREEMEYRICRIETVLMENQPAYRKAVLLGWEVCT